MKFALSCLLLSLVAPAGPAKGAETPVSVRPPDLANVHYGPQARQVLDLWRAQSAGPAPLLIYIHGGGWLGGDKAGVALPSAGGNVLPFLLAHGIAVASVNYRYSKMAPLPAPVYDAAHAVQFLRLHAQEWNLNPRRFAGMGVSAGGCSTLWLAYHNDLAEPTSSQPLARQSTRLCAAVGYSPQTSIDPEVIVGWVGEQVLNHGMIAGAVGAKSKADVTAHYPKYRQLYREFSPINFVTRDDPPALLLYVEEGPLPASTPGRAIHHPMFGYKLKEKAEAVGVDCEVAVTDLAERDRRTEAFLLRQLGQP